MFYATETKSPGSIDRKPGAGGGRGGRKTSLVLLIHVEGKSKFRYGALKILH